MVADMRNQYYRDLVGAVLHRAREVGGVRFDFIDPSLASARSYGVPLCVRGVIAQPMESGDYQYLRRKGVAVVNFSSKNPPESFPAWVAHVLSDDRAIGALAAKHLISSGLRNFGYFGNDELYYSTERAVGFREAVKKSPSPRPVRFFEWNHGVAARGGPSEWLRSLPRPIGVMAAQDHYARKLAEAAQDAGWRIPDDIAIIGVDADTVLSELAPVRLSSVRPDARRVGAAALDTLLGLVAGRPFTHIRTVPPEGISFAASAPRFHADNPPIATALRWMSAHLEEEVGVARLATMVGMSRRSFEYAFKACTSMSPYQKLLEMRMDRARELLVETNLPVIAIAEQTGFTNQREFSVRFRAKEGLPPSAYREKTSKAGTPGAH